MQFADDWQEWLNNIDDFVEDTWVGSYFKLKERNSKLSTEVRAGAVTFITVRLVVAAARPTAHTDADQTGLLCRRRTSCQSTR